MAVGVAGSGNGGVAVARGVSGAGSIFVWGGARRGGVWFLVFRGFILVLGGLSLWRGLGAECHSMWFRQFPNIL